MRTLILIAGASLALTACGKHDQGGGPQNSSEDLSAEKIVANDVTAIDAVTADDSNMAADVNYEGLDSIDANDSGDAGNGAALSKQHSTSHSAGKTKASAASSNSAAASGNSAD
jgi:hypothetical protein